MTRNALFHDVHAVRALVGQDAAAFDASAADGEEHNPFLCDHPDGYHIISSPVRAMTASPVTSALSKMDAALGDVEPIVSEPVLVDVVTGYTILGNPISARVAAPVDSLDVAEMVAAIADDPLAVDPHLIDLQVEPVDTLVDDHVRVGKVNRIRRNRR